MLTPRRLLALAFGALTLWFVACAQDAGIDASGGGGSGGASGGKDGGISGGDGSWPTGGFGAPCTLDVDCAVGKCWDVGNGTPYKACVIPCTDGKQCPPNGYCAFQKDHGYVCVPDLGNQCAKCTMDSDCPLTSDTCTPSPKVDRFCARDCSFDGQCPVGMTCVSSSGYPPGLPVNDAGVSDSGLGEAGLPTKPLKMCVPAANDSCPCDSKRDGAKRKCTKQSGTLTCEGTETCSGAAQAWQGCTAGSPQPEICDGADNDCNGTADDGTPAELCASQGTAPHATWACNFGACEIGSCDPGWAAYPPGPQKNGCACAVDAGEPNETCDAATAAGSVTDANTTALTIKGTLSSDSDVDWWKFDTVDSDETTTNSYHIKIVFSAPATNDEFVFDVIRGDTCATPNTQHSALLTYDWCVDGTGTVGGQTVGEANCSSTGAIHCGPHNKSYLLRVRRKSGATPSCTQYAVTVTAKGTGSCDFSQACDPQTSEI